MRTLPALVCLVLCSTSALARETLREISWARLKEAGGLGAGEIVPADGETPFDRLVVDGTAEASARTVATLTKPPIVASTYAIAGQVRCEGVEGKGYLELWNHFPGGGRRFSRTLAARGPMGCLEGTSPWRRFVLPFHAKGGGPAPEKLVLNVVLPGRGRVELGRVALVEYAPGEDPLAQPGQWWGERTGGLIGGVLGALMGLLGAAVGVLASRGAARGFALGAMRAMLVVGVVALAVGIVAVVQSQPYGVYYPLLLIGVLCSALPLGLLRTIRRRYEQLELRKMEAQDMA